MVEFGKKNKNFMIKILKALYGNFDVKEIIEKNYIKNNKISFSVNNDTMLGDPLPFVEKILEIEIDNDGEIFKYIAKEGENFYYPRNKFKPENSLILTSCNRVEQVLLAIAINKEIIKENFNVIVVDCSTPNLDMKYAINEHQRSDPYNIINEQNYNSNYELIEEYVKSVSNIKEYRIAHISPRLYKQPGEALLISIGLNIASLMGSKYAIKLSGACILKYDIFEKFDKYLGDDNYVATWSRTFFGNQKSTRVFICNPRELNKSIMDSGWSGWIRDYDFIERRFEQIINERLNTNVNHISANEASIIVDEGSSLHQKEHHRFLINENLKKHNLLDSKDVWIKKFLDGGIW